MPLPVALLCPAHRSKRVRVPAARGSDGCPEEPVAKAADVGGEVATLARTGAEGGGEADFLFFVVQSLGMPTGTVIIDIVRRTEKEECPGVGPKGWI